MADALFTPVELGAAQGSGLRCVVGDRFRELLPPPFPPGLKGGSFDGSALEKVRQAQAEERAGHCDDARQHRLHPPIPSQSRFNRV